ncbi:hypothetical protein HPB47_024245 [Ixodes persulcatus]|uniref:Uncharacterized protein n=1 Tax=Ixodes persulcatus TaxID=34615 RepID=A0AC60Q592_IXOPE|nr:hypothetical protein HPB47_024245 [Ixodes persulcatus]
MLVASLYYGVPSVFAFSKPPGSELEDQCADDQQNAIPDTSDTSLSELLHESAPRKILDGPVVLPAPAATGAGSTKQNNTRKDPPTWDLDERSRNFRLSRLQSEISVPYTSELEMIKRERTLQFVNSLKDNDSSYWTGSMNSSKQTSASTPEAGHSAPCTLEATYHSDVLEEESSKSAAPDDHPDIGSDEGISSVTSASPPKEHDIRVPLAIHAIWPKRLASMRSWTAQGRVKERSRHNDQFSGISNGRPEGPRDVIVESVVQTGDPMQQGAGSCGWNGTLPWGAHVDGKELHGSERSERVRGGTCEKTKF